MIPEVLAQTTAADSLSLPIRTLVLLLLRSKIAGLAAYLCLKFIVLCGMFYYSKENYSAIFNVTIFSLVSTSHIFGQLQLAGKILSATI